MCLIEAEMTECKLQKLVDKNIFVLFYLAAVPAPPCMECKNVVLVVLLYDTPLPEEQQVKPFLSIKKILRWLKIIVWGLSFLPTGRYTC